MELLRGLSANEMPPEIERQLAAQCSSLFIEGSDSYDRQPDGRAVEEAVGHSRKLSDAMSRCRALGRVRGRCQDDAGRSEITLMGVADPQVPRPAREAGLRDGG